MALDYAVLTTALAGAGDPWEAAETPLVQLADAAGSNLFGLAIADPDREDLLARAADDEALTGMLAADVELPAAVDWRTDDLVTGVRDQGTCGACVAFAVCSSLEARALIHFAQTLDLSEAHLFHCGNPDGCVSGWDPEGALAWARDNGVGLEADFPYAGAAPCTPIPSAVSVRRWSLAVSVEQRKRMLAFNGPVVGGMQVYADLPYYRSGIYQHVTGDEMALHAICVVGYDDVEACWLVKNSWGEDWGEDGFVRIAYGECGLDTKFPFFDPDLALS